MHRFADTVSFLANQIYNLAAKPSERIPFLFYLIAQLLQTVSCDGILSDKLIVYHIKIIKSVIDIW